MNENEIFQNKLLNVSNYFKMSSLFSALKMPHDEKGTVYNIHPQLT